MPNKTSIDSVNLSLTKILLVDNDKLGSALMQEQVKHFGYDIIAMCTPEDITNFLASNTPEIILVDVEFCYHSYNGIDLLRQLQAANKIHCPVIFLSNQESFAVRVDTFRAGGSGYIVKPVNILELVEILDKHNYNTLSESYRALFIADNPTAHSDFTAALESNNFTCKKLSNPLSISAELIALRPNIILLDSTIHEFNSLEIAAVIRQNNRFSHIPIIFLTTDNKYEIEAIRAGCDYILNKNTDIETFITYAISYSQRSRKLNSLIHNFRKDKLRFQVISSSSQDAIITLNKDGQIILWNKGAENIFGYQSLEVIGLTIDIIIPDQYKELHHRGFAKLIADSRQLKRSIETNAITKEQKIISIELTYSEWQSGNKQFFTCIIRDVSARKVIENDLKNQQANLTAIVNNSAEGIITINEQGIIETINPKALEIFSYAGNELINKNLSLLLPKAMRRGIEKNITLPESCLYNIINKATEFQGVRKDGSVFPIEVTLTPMIIGGKNKFVGIVHDISEQKRVLKAINKAKHVAEIANQAKSQFLSTMSHELRSPLNVILGFTQILQDGLSENFNSEQKKCLNMIDSSGQRLLNIINDVLDLSAVESGKINLTIEEINLIELVNESLELISTQATNAQITLENKLPKTDALYIKADSSRLHQVLSNLLTNAIKYNQKYGLVSIWLAQNNNKVRVYIKNTGHGIPEQKIADLFQPFKRLATNYSEIEGTGIGLTITKMLVELMNGTIGVHNEEGQSCTFWVQWDLITPIVITDKTLTALDSPAKTRAFPQHKKMTINILYIEDNLSNRLLMKKIINRQKDFNYNEAKTGSEGIQEALKIKPDIILLDINLPDMSGFEVFEQLQKHHLSVTTKVIAVSANAMQDDISKGQKSGFFDYITKPIDQQQLFASIHNALKTGES